MVFRLPITDTVPRTVSQYLLPHEKQVITVHKHPAVLVAHSSILAVACAAATGIELSGFSQLAPARRVVVTVATGGAIAEV